MKPLVLGLPHNERLVQSLVTLLEGDAGTLTVRQFPDGESYVRVESDVRGRTVVLACGLDRPDAKVLPLYLAARTLRDQGAARIILVAPYLAYMRQDRIFHEGEGISARHFAAWLSSFVDGIVTVDPHLHRIHSLAEVYPIASRVVTAAPAISQWIREQVPKAVLVGPDAESEQWVSQVAREAGAPFVILEKTRRGDRDVEVSVPQMARWSEHTPVLVDDIISTAGTMIQTVGHLRQAGMRAPVCIGVHAIFAGPAYEDLVAAGGERILTCNTIVHRSNQIDVHPLVARSVLSLLA